jgi:8-oxo-dGTP pyrophosphatase MutT (NUDIX family)
VDQIISPFDEDEFAQLVAVFGKPDIHIFEVEGDEYLYTTRLQRAKRKRGEVVLVIERPGRSVLLHRKGWYEPGVFRLLSGTIEQSERVEDALVRELEEETGLTIGEASFMGLLDTLITYNFRELSFASYVFHISHTGGVLKLPDGEEDIAAFREVPIADLPAVAANLRNVPPPRSAWGRWRAVAHDFVFEKLRQT